MVAGVLPVGRVLVVFAWVRGSWCFGVCPVFAARMSCWIDAGLWLVLVLGCCCGGAGLLFGNCIVNASILQMR